MDLAEALLDSWTRQCRIVDTVAARVDDSNRRAKPSEDGNGLDHQLAHIHRVRQFWLRRVDPTRAAALPNAFVDDWETPIESLEELRAALKASGEAIAATMRDLLSGPAEPIGGYDHPVLFLQHMVWHEGWHEGWHVGLIFLGLRLTGQEPPEEWEYANVWGRWVTE